MPKYTPQPFPMVGWIVLLAFGGTAVFCFAHAAASSPWSTLTGVVLFTVFFVLVSRHGLRGRSRIQDVAVSRNGQSICAFARDFDPRAVDTWIIRAVYEQIQNELKGVHQPFAVRADDRLKEDLLLDDDAVDMDLANEIAMRAGRSLAHTKNNPYFGKVKTVRDLVLFVNTQPTIHVAT